MHIQPKWKWLLLMVVILIITNAVSLYFLFTRDNQSSRYQERRSVILNFLKNDVGFSPGQMARFDSLSSMHKEASKPLFDSSANKKEIILLQAASNNFSDGAIDTAARAISNEQEKFEVLMLTHLRGIRSLCTPGQLPKFDKGFYKLIVKRTRNSDKKNIK